MFNGRRNEEVLALDVLYYIECGSDGRYRERLWEVCEVWREVYLLYRDLGIPEGEWTMTHASTQN